MEHSRSEETSSLLSFAQEEASKESNVIPSWDNISKHYEQRWLAEKEKFQAQLKGNFFGLVERFASGKQEIFQLCAPDRREKLYIRAFLEMFESGYAPHVGEVERLAGKKVRRLFVTLPNNYHD
jgi:hypothetical protein|tara:strand:+ start:433 stop:804 length:372 start_codon:yes stop_codon:yes gene_type:complete